MPEEIPSSCKYLEFPLSGTGSARMDACWLPLKSTMLAYTSAAMMFQLHNGLRNTEPRDINLEPHGILS